MSLIDDVGNIADLIKKMGDVELYKKILTLETEIRELTRDKQRAEDKVEELERALEFQGELKFKDPYYFLEGDPSPYCPGCWDAKRVAVHIVTITHPMLHHQRQCPSCKHIYEGGRI